MTSEFKETFSKSPSQNDSSTHDSLKLMPNLNAMPKRLSVRLFSFSHLVPSRITLKFKLQKSFLLYRPKKWAREHTGCDLWKRDITWPLSLLCAYAQTQFVLIYPIFEIKGLVNCSRDNGVKLVRASEHICLHNNKDRADTLKNCGRRWGVCFVRLFPVSHRIMVFFPTIFQTWRRINCLILCHTDKVQARWCIFLAF